MSAEPLPPEAVLFDIGNVLLNFDFNRAAAAMAADSDLPAPAIRKVLDDWQIRHETGAVSPEDFAAAVCQETGFREGEDRFREYFSDIFVPNEPMWDFARSLFGKVPVFLFSNISFWHETWLFENFTEFANFDGGFYSWRIGAMKPDEAFYGAALKALPFAPERIAYMDDVPHNVEGGRRAGFQAVLYDRTRHADFLRTAAAWVPGA